jgi:hypothetical protein
MTIFRVPGRPGRPAAGPPHFSGFYGTNTRFWAKNDEKNSGYYIDQLMYTCFCQFFTKIFCEKNT